MFHLKIVLLSAIALSSLFANCNAADDVLSTLRNAFETEFDNFAETVDHQSLIEDRASRINEHYNDAKCYEQTAILMQAFNASEQWALKVVDSWGKLPSGIFNGNLMEQGDFDQCLSISEENKFEPQYCLGVISKKSAQRSSRNESPKDVLTSRALHRNVNVFMNSPRVGPPGEDGTPKIGLTTGICVPNTCSPKMIKKLVVAMAAQAQIKDVEYDVIESTCQGNDPPKYTSGDIAAISLLSFLAFLTILSTAYDIMCTAANRNKIDVLTAFSVYTNAPKIFATKRTKSLDVLECLNGIRVLSTVWVIYGHSTVLTFPSPLYNIAYLPTWASGWFSMTLLLAPLSVDSFLFLSGLLVTWQLLKHLNQNNGKLNVPLLYLHRYIRLTPLLALAIFVAMTIMTKISNGPLWHTLLDNGINCDNNWWSALLYIQNYYNPTRICFAHSWYLSVDFQLFLVAPLLVYLLYRFGHKFLPVLMVGILASMFSIIFIMWRYDLRVKYMDFRNDFLKTFELTYYPTHTRMAPWLVGMIFGHILYNTRDKRMHFTKIHAAICWVAMLVIFGMCAWYTYVIQQLDHANTAIESGLYLALTRSMWPVGLSLLVLLCVRGYGGPVNSFLSSPNWLPLCRLSYSVYVVHMPLLLVISASSRRSFYFSTRTLLLRFFGDFTVSLALSVIAALLCESPILKIEKFVFGRDRKPVARTDTPVNIIATSQQDLLSRAE